MSTPAALSAVLARLEPLVVDDARAAQYEREVQRAADCGRAVERRERLRTARVSLRADVHRAIVLHQPLPEQPTSLAAVRRWLGKADVPPWLVLRGRPGCGKTVAAAWALANGPDGGLWHGAQPLMRLFGGYGRDLELAQERALQCPLLVVDDLGTEGDPGRALPHLVRLLEARQNTWTRTLVTTNLPPSEWERRYADERLTSRFRQLAAFVSDSGPDLRVGRPA